MPRGSLRHGLSRSASPAARTYAIDQDLAEKKIALQLPRHAHACVAGLATRHLARPLRDLRLITLHLGNGASACAVD
ncbi:MAG: hypothetical protein R3B70_16355 [Polyangiaceae bacterium]